MPCPSALRGELLGACHSRPVGRVHGRAQLTCANTKIYSGGSSSGSCFASVDVPGSKKFVPPATARATESLARVHSRAARYKPDTSFAPCHDAVQRRPRGGPGAARQLCATDTEERLAGDAARTPPRAAAGHRPCTDRCRGAPRDGGHPGRPWLCASPSCCGCQPPSLLAWSAYRDRRSGAADSPSLLISCRRTAAGSGALETARWVTRAGSAGVCGAPSSCVGCEEQPPSFRAEHAVI
jgi:hypothetical protein